MSERHPSVRPSFDCVQRILFDAGRALPGLWGTGESTQAVGRVASKSFLVCYNGLNCAWFSSAPLSPVERLAALNLLLLIREDALSQPPRHSPPGQTPDRRPQWALELRKGLHLEHIDLREHPVKSEGDRQALLNEMTQQAQHFISTHWSSHKISPCKEQLESAAPN